MAPLNPLLLAALLVFPQAALAQNVDAFLERAAPLAGTVLFTEDFEGGLNRWTFPLGAGHEVVPAGDEGGSALSLQTGGEPVYALMEGSESWSSVRIEGRVRFPENVHNYLGFIYRYVDDGGRIDFGEMYIKGNGSYVQANPHFDTNVGRLVYPEIRSPLNGEAAIVIDEWHRFALEVVDGEAHLYVGDVGAPAMTLDFGAGDRGAFGFEPRVPGGAVWIDDIRVMAIDGFSYAGRPVPDVAYNRDAYLIDWRVLGPLSSHVPAVESGDYDVGDPVLEDGRMVEWRSLATDARGALVTGAVTEFRGGRRVAYFRTEMEAEAAEVVTFGISSVDELAVWVNGMFQGFAPRQAAAWWDAATNEEHAPIQVPVMLREGSNELVIRVTGGGYATGGLFVRLER